MLVVYLAGGMKKEWREYVKEEVPGVLYLDPTTSGLQSEEKYTDWDLTAIELSDVIFANLEVDNQSGYGVMYEMGYARGLDKKIIFVNGKLPTPMNKYCGLARVMADYEVSCLESGIMILTAMVEKNIADNSSD